MLGRSFRIIKNVISTQNGTKQMPNTQLLIQKKKYKKEKKRGKKILLTVRQSGVKHKK